MAGTPLKLKGTVCFSWIYDVSVGGRTVPGVQVIDCSKKHGACLDLGMTYIRTRHFARNANIHEGGYEHLERASSSSGDAFAIFSTTSDTVKKSSSVGLQNLFMLKWLRSSEYFSVASDTSRQPELSLTINL